MVCRNPDCVNFWSRGKGTFFRMEHVLTKEGILKEVKMVKMHSDRIAK